MSQLSCRQAGRRLLPGLLAVLLGGCLEGRPSQQQDPLLGGPGLPPPGQISAATRPGALTRAPDRPLPLPQAPASSGSQAVLAAGSPPPGTAPELRIDTTSASADPRWHAPGEAPRAVLNAPQSITPAAQPAAPPSAVVPAGGAARVDGYQQAMQLLDSKGVTWRSLTRWGGSEEWFFACAIPSRQNPSIQHKYEARAPGEAGLAAIRAVIQQIERDQR